MAIIHEFKINGQNFKPFVDWQDAEVVATHDDSGMQLNITVSNVVFVNEAAVYIRNYISGGITGATNGILEGLPFDMIVQDGNSILTPFSGCLNFSEQYKEISPVRVQCALSRIEDKTTIYERSKGISMLLLKEEGYITTSDYVKIPYIVEKKFNLLEFMMLSLTTYMLLKELAEATRKLSEDIAEVTALATGGMIGTGQASAILLAVVKAALNLAYAILMIIYIIDLIKDLVNMILSPVREFKGMKLKTMLEKSCDYIGYDYSSSAPEMEYLYYLPSKDKPATLSTQISNVLTGDNITGQPDDGIPNSGDVGHTFEELLSLHSDIFKSKLKITQTTVHQEALVNDGFWENDSNYTIPDVLNESKVYNTDELNSRLLIRFEKDELDRWTIDDPVGRIYEVVTHPVTVSDKRCVKIKGYKEVRPGVSLGSRKSGLTDIEIAILELTTLADSVVNFFGGNSNLSGLIQNRVGYLKISDQTTSVAKLLYLKPVNGVLKMPSDYKTHLSAKAQWDNYLIEGSFVETVGGVQNRGQKQYLSDEAITIPFGFSDFVNLINNTRVNTVTGEKAQITDLRYKPAKDKAKIQGWVRRKYTSNLQHTFYNSDDPNL